MHDGVYIVLGCDGNLSHTGDTATHLYPEMGDIGDGRVIIDLVMA